MGMFDAPEFPTWYHEKYTEETIVKLEGLRLGGIAKLPMGDAQVVLAKIGGEEYALTGIGFVNQVSQLSKDDLPAMVKIFRKPLDGGNEVKIFIPA